MSFWDFWRHGQATTQPKPIPVAPIDPPTHFDRAFTVVVGEEGGYSADPRDPGGETKFGISKRAYPALDIPNLTLAEAKRIYRADYWDKLGCDTRPWAEALCVFDCGVNQGVNRARELLLQVQRGDDFVARFQAERMLRYAKLPSFEVYGRGWSRRLVRIAIEASK